MDERKYDIPPIYCQPPYNPTSTIQSSPPITNSSGLPPLGLNNTITQSPFSPGQPLQFAPNFSKPKLNLKRLMVWVVVGIVILLMVMFLVYIMKNKGKLKDKFGQFGSFGSGSKSKKGTHSEKAELQQKGGSLDVRSFQQPTPEEYAQMQAQQQYAESIRDRGTRAMKEADLDSARISRSGLDDRLMSDQDSALPDWKERFYDKKYKQAASKRFIPAAAPDPVNENGSLTGLGISGIPSTAPLNAMEPMQHQEQTDSGDPNGTSIE